MRQTTRIKSLINYSTKTFQNSNMGDVQTNARKATEAFCKLLIVLHYGNQRGNDIIFSEDEEFNRIFKISKQQKRQKKEFVLSMLIRVIFQHSDVLEQCYQKKYSHPTLKKVVDGYKEYLQRYINVLIFSGNASAHESTFVRFNSDDVIVVQKILAKLLYWLFDEYLQQDIPDELFPYIGKYDIFLSYRHSQKSWIETLRQNLELHGYKIFIDKHEMVGGENSKLRLKRAIDNSKTAVLVVSSDYQDSEWIAREYEWMRERSVDNSSFRIIPILIDAFSAPPDEHLHCIDFVDREYRDVLYELICAIERKSANSKITFQEDRIVLPPKETSTHQEHPKRDINLNILQQLRNSLTKMNPTVIFNSQKKSIDREIELFVTNAKERFDEIYTIESPKLIGSVESDFLQKLKEEAGLVESQESKYIKSISSQCHFYQTVKRVTDWSDLVQNQLKQESRILIVFEIDEGDEFYHLICDELSKLLFLYQKYLKIAVLIEKSPKNLKNICQNMDVMKI
jgi:hypothetical protein